MTTPLGWPEQWPAHMRPHRKQPLLTPLVWGHDKDSGISSILAGSKFSLYPIPMDWCKTVVTPRSRLNIKMLSYRYRKSHCGDKTVVDRLISTMWFPILVRCHLYIDSEPSAPHWIYCRLASIHWYKDATFVGTLVSHWGLKKWSLLRRWHFEIHFLETKCVLINISLKFAAMGSVGNESTLVQGTAWPQTYYKLLFWTNVDHVLWCHMLSLRHKIYRWLGARL